MKFIAAILSLYQWSSCGLGDSQFLLLEHSMPGGRTLLDQYDVGCCAAGIIPIELDAGTIWFLVVSRFDELCLVWFGTGDLDGPNV